MKTVSTSTYCTAFKTKIWHISFMIKFVQVFNFAFFWHYTPDFSEKKNSVSNYSSALNTLPELGGKNNWSGSNTNYWC